MIAQTVPVVCPVGNILEEGEGGLAGTPLLPGSPYGSAYRAPQGKGNWLQCTLSRKYIHRNKKVLCMLIC